ncbi:DNA polymerase III subunit delta [Candidatus Saccharibacteria bacterium 32-49-12]|nr:MAG: DNA polymerase III subunit delta [Candidatus Saccharibacteria bacterium 32-49-12]
MITVLTGDNSFEINRALGELTDNSNQLVENYDGETLTLEQAADIFSGISFFGDGRTVIIRSLSSNGLVWAKLTDFLNRHHGDTTVILIEPKLDKRTSTYKELKSAGAIREFHQWTARDDAAALQWLAARLADEQIEISSRDVRYLLERVGRDQWALARAVEKLALIGRVDQAVIDEQIEASADYNIFQLLELALLGKAQAVEEELRSMRLSQDPFALMALIGSQVVQLLAVASATKSDHPAQDFSIHPYVVGKMERLSRNVDSAVIRRAVRIIADTDYRLKSSVDDPWLAIELALRKISRK